MNIDDASLTLLKVNQIEQFINTILIQYNNKKKEISLNPELFISIVYTEYINSLRMWRSADKFSSNPNPFFPKYDINISTYQHYHETIMHMIEEFIFQNSHKNVLLLSDLVDYLKEEDLNNNDTFELYSNLSKLKKSYQIFILNQTVLATYESKGYQSTIDAFQELFVNNTYKTFARYRMKGLEMSDKTDYHKLMTANIKKDEIVGLINSCMLQFHLNYKYQFVPDKEFFQNYVDQLIFNYQTQLLDKTITSLISEVGKEEAIDKIYDYVSDKEITGLLTGNENERIINRYKIKKYLKPKFMIGYFQMKNMDYSLEIKELIEQYIDVLIKPKQSQKQ